MMSHNQIKLNIMEVIVAEVEDQLDDVCERIKAVEIELGIKKLLEEKDVEDEDNN